MLRNHRSGQAMLIAVLTLGGAVLGATTLAGFLLLYQIRAGTDSENSAKAVFAADSGINWALYSYFKGSQGPFLDDTAPGAPATGNLPNGASAVVTCSDENSVTVPCSGPHGVTTTVVAEGTSLGSRRAFFWYLTYATGTLP